jgi:hypothetical protein
MIMVRRGELACRNDWSQDLWTAAEGDQPKGAEATGTRFELNFFPSTRVSPATEREIAAMVSPRPVGTEAQPVQEDVVVGVGPVISDSDPSWELDLERAAATQAFDTRAAILRARDRYRAKIAAPSRSTQRAASEPNSVAEQDTDQATESDSPNRADPATTPDRTAEVAAASRGPEQRADQPIRLELPVESPPAPDEPAADRFASIPDIDPAFDLPRARPVASQPLVADAGTDPAVPEAPASPRAPTTRVVGDAVSEDRVGAGRRRSDARPSPVSVQVSGEGFPPDSAPVDRAAEQPDADPVRVNTPRPGSSARSWGGLPPVPTREIAARAEPREHRRPGVPAPDPIVEVEEFEAVVEPPLAAHEAVAIEPPSRPTAPLTVAGRHEFDSGLLDMTIRIAPTVPRMCRTCRDFRPAEGGDRGWCANPWAFTHRRMVDPNDVPCQTSLGCWWLPADDVWSTAVDISGHGQPTPLFDAFLHFRTVENHSAEPLRQRRRS